MAVKLKRFLYFLFRLYITKSVVLPITDVILIYNDYLPPAQCWIPTDRQVVPKHHEDVPSLVSLHDRWLPIDVVYKVSISSTGVCLFMEHRVCPT